MAVAIVAVFAGPALSTVTRATDAVRLTSLQRVQGWRLLFDGESLDAWRGYRTGKIPPEWQMSGGLLSGRGGKALVTEEDFKDFELEFEWMVGEGGIGSVYFHVSEDGATPGDTGPVMELATRDGQTGGNGGLMARQLVRGVRAGDWYRAKLVVFGNHVEHWINGEKVLDYMLDDSEWRRAKASSAFRNSHDYGLLPQGRIVLEGQGITFRYIKVRTMP
ncbi:MAG: DUF1080 domain-containing protein [Opitutaceae bacterium]|nr:DUF1080 domain-containing protein [Opitutaceae bacterium]